ncbi:hypothetical protein ABEB36_008847 [Hypothenemus hampei]|uniref:Protein quiver n=1 Tax=Hypothenemus hampei TaxID=57062 RepID=A0ABD1ENC9_HYPHA
MFRRTISTLIISFLLGSANTLECFTCSGHTGFQNPLNNCDMFSYYESHKVSLCMPDQVCAKYVVNHDGMTWVHRSCRPYDICEYLRSMYSNGRDQLLECATCNGNLCNNSNRKSTFSFLIFGFLIFSYLVYC